MNTIERAIALNEERKRVWAESQNFLKDLDERGGDTEMNAEERSQWQRYNERIDALAAERDELMERAKNDQENQELRIAQDAAFGQDSSDQEKRDADTVRAFLRGETRNAETDYNGKRVNALSFDVMRVARERELLRMGASPEEIRDLAWDTGDSASHVPTTMDRRLYEVLEANIAMMRMPTTRISTNSGETMEFPKVDAHAIATQVAGQGTALAGTDPSFDKLTLTPVKHGQLIKLASEVVSDSGVDIVGFVSRDLGRAVGRKINEYNMGLLTGSAFVGEGGTVATGGSLITPTYENLVDLEYSVNDAYRAGNTAWLMNDKTAGILRKLRDGAGGTLGAPIWQPSLQGGIAGLRTPDQLFNYPVYTDPNVAESASNAKIIYFGDWSSYYLRTVGSLQVERSDEAGFDNDQVHFRGKWRSTSGAQDVNAISILRQNVS